MDKAEAEALVRRFVALPRDKRRTFWSALRDNEIDLALLPIPGGIAVGERREQSYAQRRMWLLWQLDREASAYHIATAQRLSGELDAAALEGALLDLCRRHEALRTTFDDIDGSLAQLVHPEPRLDFARVDLGEDAARLGDLLRAGAAAPFDLAQGPLLRASLIRLGEGEHVLQLVMHHIIADAWSLRVMVEDLSTFYAARLAGAAAGLPALEVQYSDYALWQRSWLEAGEGERQLAWWKERLGDGGQVLELPTDRPRPAIWSYRGAVVRCVVPKATATALGALAQRSRTTPFVVLLTAFAALLHRWSGQEDLRIGVPVANRTRAETEGLIGLFVNTQVIRVEVAGEAGFAGLLDEVKEAALGAQAHQDLPFEQLVDALRPERSLGRNPLFQVMFGHERTEAGDVRLGNLRVEELPFDAPVAQFDLALATQEQADGSLVCAFTYATDLFDAATIERLGGWFANLLEGIAAMPEQVVGDLPLLAGDERRWLVEGCNDTATAYDTGLGLLARLRRQAEATPAATALVVGAERLDYRTLHGRADRLAAELRAQGVGPEALVGLFAERSVAMVVGILGILKAGAAWVPLDPELPPDRLAYMVTQSGMKLVLAQRHLPPPAGDVPARILEQDDGEAGAPAPEPQPGQLAYVIYTSGTTGRPKGVGNSHAGLLNRLLWMQEQYRLTSADRVLQKTPFGFDVSVWEFLWPLMTGATLVMAPPGAHRDPAVLRDLIQAEGITVLHFVPSMLQAFMAVEEIGACTSLRAVICSGEALPVNLQRRFLAASRAGLHNLYGPTEAAIDVTFWQCRDEPGRGSVPIGRPVANTQIHLLDQRLALVPVGVLGELCIGGVQLARGYLGRPALTAERFVPDSFAGDGSRLYRTGDLARRRPDGAIEYAGRTDHQVKIRGMRVEPGEVEALLREDTAVRDAAVVAADGPSGARLIGYVAADDEPGLRDRLLGRLRERLPEHMVPSALTVLDQLPLSANGKLDRRALPASAPAATETALASPDELALARIWQDLLGCGEVGAEANFFALGGDSITAIQVVARAREHGLALTPKDLFQHQTVRALARAATAVTGLPAGQGPVVGPLELAPLQARFLAMSIPNRHHWNQAVLLRPTGRIEPGPLRRALAALVTAHDALRLRFAEAPDGRWHAEHGAHAMEILWTRRVDGADSLAAVCAEAQRSLDLAGDLVRAVLIDGPDGQRLLLVIHHLVVDGVSWRILLDDLQSACRQAAVGDAVRLPGRTTSFRDWNAHLHELVALSPPRDELDRWCGELATAYPGLEPDTPAGSALLGDAASIDVALDPRLTRELLTTAAAAYRARPAELLLTALARAVCGERGAGSLLVEVEGHGRDAHADGFDLSRTVGWLTSAWPVRLTPAGDPGEALLAIKEQLRAVPDGGAGFGVLRWLGDVATRERLASLPAPHITFNYLGQLDGGSGDGALFRLADEDVGPLADPDAPLSNLLSIDGGVLAGSLRLTWTFAREQFAPGRIEALAAAFERELKALIAHCLEPGAGGISPSDFPLAGLDRAQLPRLPVAAREIEDVYPLAPLQQGLLFQCLYDTEAETYLNQIRATVAGLDVTRFAAAWQAAQDRHAVLRTSFSWQDVDRPVQIVHRSVPLDLRLRELGDATLDELAEADRREGFDLLRAPLTRLTLIELPDGRHHLIWTCHHLVLDGWSAAQVLDEVLAHYAGTPAAPPAPPYRDFVARLLRRDAATEERFWCERLAEVDGPLHLAEAIGQTGAEAGFGELVSGLDRIATGRVQEFARQQKVTLNTLVQAGWLLLLQRYTGRRDVLFGATVSGRSAGLPGMDRQVGLLINTLPLAAAPDATQPVGAWLERVQALAVALREHEQTPLHDIQRWLGWSGAGGFDTILVFENYPLGETLRVAAPGGLTFADVSAHEQSGHPLMVEVSAGDGLRLHYRYDRSHFPDAVIARLDRHLRRLLVGLAEDASRPIGAVPMLLPDEVSRAEAGLAGAASLEALLAGVWSVPAVVAGDVVISRAELFLRAGRLAARLRSAGVGPEVVVAVALERTPLLLETLLGVLMAGGAYLPLDPDFPPERLTFMLEDSGARLLLTERHLRHSLPAVAEAWCLDEPVDGPEAGWLAVDARHPAYLIYTSGSTGLPKGVVVGRAALANFLLSMAREPGLVPGERMLALTSLSFDIAALELFLPLAAGGTVVLVGREEARDPALLAAAIERHAVGVVQATPSTWRMLESAGRLGVTAGRRVLCGGEALPPDLGQSLVATAAEVWNLYGPTETTVWSAMARLDPAAPEPVLGGPVAATSLAVLGGALEPVPPVVTGELFIGGAGLARGYHGRPGLTAERFVPDPDGEGDRLYRTGDLVRRRVDGALDYRGRADQQVKLRGHRIEPGEIEARLLEHPLVREAAVVVRSGRGGPQLVAYVVAEPEALQLAGRLKAHLQAGLPEHLIPGHIQELDHFPLTPNRKLDRNALPEPEAQVQASRPPATQAEAAVAAIWRELLSVDAVGAEANFFELGGHSLLATQLVARLRDRFGVELPLRAVFETRTLADLARAVEGAAGPPAASARLQVTAGEDAQELSSAQARLWFFAQLEPRASLYNVAGAVRLAGPLDLAALQHCCDRLVERHPTLRTRFEDGEEPRQVVMPVAGVALVVEDLSHMPADAREIEARERAEQEASRPFDLGQGSLLRFRLLRMAEAEHILMLTLHHVAVDGGSIRVLVEELEQLYAARRRGEVASLPEPQVCYTDFVRWQRDHLASGAAQRQVDYWRERLGEDLAVLELPPDRPQPLGYRQQGALHRFALEPALADRVRAFARASGVTLFMVLLAAFAVVLHERTGSRRVRIGGDAANRNNARLERLVGFFVNQVVLQVDIDPSASVRDLLDQCCDVVIGAAENQDLPFNRLVEALRPPRRAGRSPLFSIKLIYQEGDDPLPRLSGLTVEPYAAGATAAELDLVASFENGAETIKASFQCPRDLFAPATIAGLFAQTQAVLEAVAGGEAATVADLVERAAAARPPSTPAITPPELRRIARAALRRAS